MKLNFIMFFSFAMLVSACADTEDRDTHEESAVSELPNIDHTLTKDQTHNKFSRLIPPILRVQPGEVIEAFTEDASDGQLSPGSDLAALDTLNFEPIHPLTGPVYVEGAQPGEVLKVTLLKIELGSWGWNAIIPGFGFLADTIKSKYIRTYEFDKNSTMVKFNDKITLPLRPFPGVMGVAPATDEMLSTIPPRANGGNMDDPNMTEGTTIYFPVFVEGALFSIGDGHATQGLGEVCGTAIEAPLRVVYKIDIIRDRKIQEPQYETEDYYATTGFATTIDEAAKKATLYMVQYLEDEHHLSREEAYALCSLSGDLKIAEVVDVPNMLVTMHMSKKVLGVRKGAMP